jgi:hypothetical protein
MHFHALSCTRSPLSHFSKASLYSVLARSCSACIETDNLIGSLEKFNMEH